MGWVLNLLVLHRTKRGCVKTSPPGGAGLNLHVNQWINPLVNDIHTGSKSPVLTFGVRVLYFLLICPVYYS